jgi:BirA family biotin operon repressor/biotin-[acetyl-CoA-carboxylase] ligase
MTSPKAPFEYKHIHFDSISSTNSEAMKQANEGTAEGLVITADFQTNGRGKPGNKWESPRAKNLMFSVLLRPPVKINKAPMLTQIACRSVAKALTDYNVESTFKRPNDIMVKGKKICGVLTESASTAVGLVEFVVIGIGLNVNTKADELLETATSMLEIRCKQTNRNELLEKILTYLKEDTYELYAHAS